MEQYVNLEKGGRVDLEKQVPGLKRIRVGLGWKENKFSTGGDYDLDVTAFVLKHDADGNAKCASPDFMLFYNNLNIQEGTLIHSGDNQNGSAPGDDESIIVDVARAIAIADEISFIVTIHEATKRGQKFGQIDQAHITIYNEEDGKVIANYDLGEGFSNETAVQFGSLYKNPQGNMAFRAVGQGFNAGLGDFCKGYGLGVK